MARPLRLEYPGALWHITSRGNEQHDIVRDDTDRLKFLGYLARAVERFGWILHAYCLMSNHFHLVIETPQCTLSRGMHWLNGCYAQAFNRRHDRKGHLFQGRFKGILVDSNEYFLELCRYVVLNPVRAGMVPSPEQYEWSSYRPTAGLAPVPAWLSVDPLLSRLGRDPSKARSVYRELVCDGLRVPSPWEKLSGQMYLGGTSFLRFIQDKIDEQERSDEHPRAMREIGCPSLDELTAAVARTFETPVDAILSAHGGPARTALAHLGWHQGRLRLGQIGHRLGLRSAGHVSTLIRRSSEMVECDAAYRDRLEACRAQFHRPPPPSVVARL